MLKDIFLTEREVPTMTTMEKLEALNEERERLINEQVQRGAVVQICMKLKKAGFSRRESIAILHRAEEEILKDMF
jgi:hypothetical protein